MSLRILTGVVLLVVAFACRAEVLGWVEMVDGAIDETEIRHGKTLVPAAPLTQVSLGDEISVHGETRITLILSGVRTEVHAGNSPYTITQAVEEQTVVGNLTSWLATKVGFPSGKSPRDYAAAVGAVSRGTQVAFAYTQDGAQVVERDQLYVAWHGGLTPFQLEVLDALGKPVAETETSGQEAFIDIAGVSPGAYQLVLNDSRGVRETLSIEIIAACRVPSLLAATSDLSATDRNLYQAAYLIEQFNGEWNLEAVQLLAGSTDPRAQRLLAILRTALATEY